MGYLWQFSAPLASTGCFFLKSDACRCQGSGPKLRRELYSSNVSAFSHAERPLHCITLQGNSDKTLERFLLSHLVSLKKPSVFCLGVPTGIKPSSLLCPLQGCPGPGGDVAGLSVSWQVGGVVLEGVTHD